MRFAELDAVTVDGFGTLVTLEDPVPALRRALVEYGVERSPAQVASAFADEAAYYRPHAHLGRDAETLAALRRDCVCVFLEALEADLDAGSFTPSFLDALHFSPVAGAVETLEALRRRGLALAVVANWDCALPRHLHELGLSALFAAVVTSAEAGVPKPDPAPFLLALERLGSEPARTLHVGDEPADELGARAAGLHFAPAPLDEAFEGWA
jgi:FMN phosphatase YigB (HAD superfamily)